MSQMKLSSVNNVRRIFQSLNIIVLILTIFCGVQVAYAQNEKPEWKAGAAAVAVTPGEMTWMAGYASRDKPAEGKFHDLFAKALALEDVHGNRCVMVTLDLIGVPRSVRENVEQRVEKEWNLPPSGLLMNASHTHSGPELRSRYLLLKHRDAKWIAMAEAYTADLENKIVELVGKAISNLAPANLYYSHGRAGVSMNRRLPTPGGVNNSPYPDGLVDQDVPVLIVESPEKELKTILFGYACHNTTLALYQYCGDYAGYAQEYLEADHPGTIAMFMMGCGGDQNPYPRGTQEWAQRHGRSLANAAEAALQAHRKVVHGPLKSAYDYADLEFAPPASREELLKSKESTNFYEKLHAETLLDELDTSGAIRTHYSYPIQVVKLGPEILLIALAGEVVVDYSLELKRRFGNANVWVAGYSNDVFGYVPSLRVLREGGYEGRGAMLYTSLPGPFTESVEEIILDKVDELVQEVSSK
ncbi:MAG: neutral/alkaline non-lysosomal ceramidase N-terminal domain-containing protein [Planctomycetaceae bacterium]